MRKTPLPRWAIERVSRHNLTAEVEGVLEGLGELGPDLDKEVLVVLELLLPHDHCRVDH